MGTLLFLLTLGILGVFLGSFKPANYVSGPNKDELNIKQAIKTGFVLLTALAVAFLNPIKIQRIDAGYIGLKIDRIGNEKGVPVARSVKGWVFYNSWVSDVIELSIQQQHVQYLAFQVTTKGGFPITVAPSFNYSLKSEKAADLYINLLKGSDFSTIETSWLLTATTISLNNASNNYTIDSIFNNKQHYQADVAAELNREISGYFTVSQINPGVSPPKELQDVIVAKTNAIQKAQQAELSKIQAVAEAETKIATARGDSAQKVIAALAEAQAIKVKTSEISSNYIEYIKWLAWDGKLPSTVLGNSSNILLQK